MKLVLGGLMIMALIATFFLFFTPRTVMVSPPASKNDPEGKVASANLPSVPEPELPTSTSPAQPIVKGKISDLPDQPQLPNPPEIIKGIYVTAWSAGSLSRINALIALAQRTEINAMVVDIKDYSGHVSYRTGITEVAATGAEGEIRIIQPNALIKKLHDAGIYVIARQTVFQDPILAKAHPEWALKNASSGKVWLDNKKLAWMDAAAKPVWEYNVSIAKDALARGFDEVQFDYVRFASDGDLGQISYPFWDKKTARHKIIAQFFKFLRDSLPDKKISADFFGLSTIDTWDDLGIGQIIEDAYKNFDYVSPMVYPSHFAVGFLGYKNPAAHPYEIIKYSMEKARERLITYNQKLITNSSSSTSTSSVMSYRLSVKLRPWLQDFDLGATYDAAMVRKQIQATYDAFLAHSTSTSAVSSVPNGSGQTSSTTNEVNGQLSNVDGHFGGWLLWDPANTYTEGALQTRN